MLEHHAKILSNLVQLALLISYTFPFDEYLPVLRFLEEVHTSQERTLTTTGSSDNHNDLTLLHTERDVLQDMEVTVELVQFLDSEKRGVRVDGLFLLSLDLFFLLFLLSHGRSPSIWFRFDG